MARVGEGIESVSGGGDPGKEKREEVEEGDARVQPSVRIGLVEGGVACHLSEAKHFWPGRAPLHLARVHVRGVGRDVIVEEWWPDIAVGADLGVFGVVAGFGAATGGADDGDFGGDDAGERVLVERVQQGT